MTKTLCRRALYDLVRVEKESTAGFALVARASTGWRTAAVDLSTPG
jgi:hypothetical protein